MKFCTIGFLPFAFITPMAAYAESQQVSFFGKRDADLQSVRTSQPGAGIAASRNRIASNASRVGARGSKRVTDAFIYRAVFVASVREPFERLDAELAENRRIAGELKRQQEHLEERVSERTRQLEDANRELESFSYSVSHDLRTPLRAIDGFSHQVLNRYADKLDDEGRHYLNLVRDNAQKMGRLIDDILAFSRMGRLEMSRAEVDMEALARAVFEEVRAASGREISVEFKPLPPATGDLAMLRQVWVNLLGNAVKFTRNKTAQIEVGACRESAETVYYVRDNGAGFDMRYADKLFGVFQRLHGEEEFEGTGIGLATVKRIVTRHGGRVWAQGKVNEGATFYFALPTKGEK